MRGVGAAGVVAIAAIVWAVFHKHEKAPMHIHRHRHTAWDEERDGRLVAPPGMAETWNQVDNWMEDGKSYYTTFPSDGYKPVNGIRGWY